MLFCAEGEICAPTYIKGRKTTFIFVQDGCNAPVQELLILSFFEAYRVKLVIATNVLGLNNIFPHLICHVTVIGANFLTCTCW